MDNKELYEIMQEYAESTKNKKDRAFKKLNDGAEHVKQTKKPFKPQFVVAMIICSVVLVLCITLPLTLGKDTADFEPRYCGSMDIVYTVKDDVTVLQDEYEIDAMYPTYNEIAASLVSSLSDPGLKGALLGYFTCDETMIEITMLIIPNSYILNTYKGYFQFETNTRWEQFEIKYMQTFNQLSKMYILHMYFTDGKYDYFVTVNSDDNLSPTYLLDMLYN